MLYHFDEDNSVLRWAKHSEGDLAMTVQKNGRSYHAALKYTGKAWKMRLTESRSGKYIVELRFPDLSEVDAMEKTEFYVMESI